MEETAEFLDGARFGAALAVQARPDEHRGSIELRIRVPRKQGVFQGLSAGVERLNERPEVVFVTTSSAADESETGPLTGRLSRTKCLEGSLALGAGPAPDDHGEHAESDVPGSASNRSATSRCSMTRHVERSPLNRSTSLTRIGEPTL
jgi:hypothetical protein